MGDPCGYQPSAPWYPERGNRRSEDGTEHHPAWDPRKDAEKLQGFNPRMEDQGVPGNPASVSVAMPINPRISSLQLN